MSPSAEPSVPVPPPGVGRTAIGVARVRAAETLRPDRLFDDPYAQAFVDAAPGALPTVSDVDADTLPFVRWLAFFVSIRTRFYDDHLRAAVAAGCGQVVLLAAGLDARAYRLEWPPGLPLFELDTPDVLGFKQAVLDARGAVPRARRTAIGTDLISADWPASLLAAGFTPGTPTAWLVEGLLIYLTAEEVTGLLAQVTRLSAPGSRLACELQAPRRAPGDHGEAAGAVEHRPRLAGYTELWKGGLGSELPGRLADLGWAVDVLDRSDVALGYGRPGPPSGGAGFVSAVRPAG